MLPCTDAIEDWKTCASDIFYEFKVQNRPGVIPPFSINGGNRAAGGQHNLFDENGFPHPLPPDGEEEYGEEDDDYDENQRPQDLDDPLCDGAPKDYPPPGPFSTRHSNGDSDSTTSSTYSGASSTGSKRAPKALNIGGSAGARKKQAATPRSAGAVAANVMVTALGKFRVLDDLKDADREKAAAAEREAARAHELKIAEMQLRALAPPPPKDLKLQLIELKELLDEDFITQEEYSLKRQSLLASF